MWSGTVVDVRTADSVEWDGSSFRYGCNGTERFLEAENPLVLAVTELNGRYSGNPAVRSSFCAVKGLLVPLHCQNRNFPAIRAGEFR